MNHQQQYSGTEIYQQNWLSPSFHTLDGISSMSIGEVGNKPGHVEAHIFLAWPDTVVAQNFHRMSDPAWSQLRNSRPRIS